VAYRLAAPGAITCSSLFQLLTAAVNVTLLAFAAERRAAARAAAPLLLGDVVIASCQAV